MMTTDERLRLLYARLERENGLLLALLQSGISRSEALCRLEADARGHLDPELMQYGEIQRRGSSKV